MNDEKEVIVESVPKESKADIKARKKAEQLAAKELKKQKLEEKKKAKAEAKAHKKLVTKQIRDKQGKVSFAEMMSFVALKSQIESYGYKYSFRNFLLSIVAYVAVVVGVSIVTKLQGIYVLILLLAACIATPFLIRAQFEKMYQIKRFQMVVSYLDNMIPVFKTEPSIVRSWEMILDLTDGVMHDCIKKALDYVVNNTTDRDVYQTAFKFIEDEFPNRRIHSVHQMMYTIVRKASKGYHESIDNMYMDVQQWITRTFDFQKDLNDRRTKLIMLAFFSMGCNCLFSYMFANNEVLAGFPDMAVYQISNFIFLGALFLMVCAIMIKMNGQWLVNDMIEDDMDKYKKALDTAILHPVTKPSKMDYILSAGILVFAVLYYFKIRNVGVSIAIGALALFMLNKNKMSYNSAMVTIKEQMIIEFPLWLRDVALNLNHLRVVLAIEASLDTSSNTMKHFVNEFLNEIKKTPHKIDPFDHFLRITDSQDIRSNMKILYTFRRLSQDQVNAQINSLIVRNQSMLAKSEEMRNKKSISGIEALGFLPVVLLVLQLLVSMGLLFYYIMNMLGSSMGSLGF